MTSEPMVCVVVKAWPRISTTFIAQELVGLEKLGLRLWVASMRPGEKRRHGLHDRLHATIHYLPDPLRGPVRILRAWAKVRRRPGYARAYALFRADMARGATRQRVVAFTQAIALVAELPAEVGLIYSHFIHSAGTLSRYAADMAGLPLVASAHAKDIWTTPDWDKRAKLAVMRWCTTCTSDGAEHLRQLADNPKKIHLIHHGLDFSRFPRDPPRRAPRDGSDPSDPVRLLSIGRAVEKKGFDVMLDGLARLPAGLSWCWHHVGGGPLLADLKERARTLGLSERIEWHGVEDQASVIARYRECDLFVLPSREAADGDRDGLPNVLMEAQSQGLACLSTRFSGIPELIEDSVTGMLVPTADGSALAAAMAQLISSPELRGRIGAAGMARVRDAFEAQAGIREIAGLLRETMSGTAGTR